MEATAFTAHATQRLLERGISVEDVVHAKSTGRLWIAVNFSADAEREQAKENAGWWGERIETEPEFEGLLKIGTPVANGCRSLGGKPRMELELIGSENGLSLNLVEWLKVQGYFGEDTNRVLYKQRQGDEELVVVEGLSGHKGLGNGLERSICVITAFLNRDPPTKSADYLYSVIFPRLLLDNADEDALDEAFSDHVWLNEEKIWVVGPGPNHSISSWPPRRPFLLMASQFGCTKIVNKLVRHYGCSVGPEIVWNKKGSTALKGLTALHLAAWNGHADVVELLLRFGADRTAINSEGETALKCAQQAMKAYASGTFEGPSDPFTCCVSKPHAAFRKIHVLPSWDRVLQLLTEVPNDTEQVTEEQGGHEEQVHSEHFCFQQRRSPSPSLSTSSTSSTSSNSTSSGSGSHAQGDESDRDSVWSRGSTLGGEGCVQAWGVDQVLAMFERHKWPTEGVKQGQVDGATLLSLWREDDADALFTAAPPDGLGFGRLLFRGRFATEMGRLMADHLP